MERAWRISTTRANPQSASKSDNGKLTHFELVDGALTFSKHQYASKLQLVEKRAYLDFNVRNAR